MSAKGKINRLSRQKSIMVVESNPLESGEASLLPQNLKVENLNHATLIGGEEFKSILAKLESLAETSNEELLAHLESVKGPYLFTSEHLSSMIDLTTSIRTKIAIIGMIGPRLIDPKAKILYFTGLFRYSDEKAAVEEVLKARAHVLTTALFTRKDGIRSFGGRGSAVAGGRNPLRGGRGGRVANWRSVHKPNQYAFTRHVRAVPSDDSVENQMPTVFGFDAVLDALDQPYIPTSSPVKSPKAKSQSLETIQESRGKSMKECDNEEEDDDDNEDGNLRIDDYSKSHETTETSSDQLKMSALTLDGSRDELDGNNLRGQEGR